MSMAPTFTYGVAQAADVAGKTGRDLLQAIIDGRLPQPPICKTLTFWLAEVSDGFAAFEGEAGAHLLNPLGVVHGGWALTLIDSATGCAAQSLLPVDTAYTTVETKANFCKAIKHDPGRVRAESTAVSRGRQVITCESKILDSTGRILAHGTSTLLVLQGPRRQS